MSAIAHLLHTAASFALVLGVLVFIHEFGHYLAARWRGIHVEAFSIGFGPALLSWTDRHETVWKLCALPLGGFVKMHGMALNVADENAMDEMVTRPGQAFFEKTVLSRAIVVAAGPIANFILAIVLFTALFAAVGRQVPLPEIGEITPGSSAEAAGLKVGDVIRAVDGKRVMEFDELCNIVVVSAGRTLSFSVHRGTQDLTVPVMIKPKKPGDMSAGLLGVSSGEVATVPVGMGAAVLDGLAQSWFVLTGILGALGHILGTGEGLRGLGGPIAIFAQSGKEADLGVASLVNFIANLSINLGLMNLLPIPILDGGHLVFYAAEAVRGRPLPARAMDYGYRVGFAIIGSLFIFVSFNDILTHGAVAVRWVTHLIG